MLGSGSKLQSLSATLSVMSTFKIGEAKLVRVVRCVTPNYSILIYVFYSILITVFSIYDGLIGV